MLKKKSAILNKIINWNKSLILPDVNGDLLLLLLKFNKRLDFLAVRTILNETGLKTLMGRLLILNVSDIEQKSYF